MALYLDQARERKIKKLIEAGATVSSFVPPEFSPPAKRLSIDLGKKVASGQYVDLYCPPALPALYARQNLCLKVFKYGTNLWGANPVMGVSNIYESTVVQNLMAYRGKAPRVYDLVLVGNNYAQVTDYITGPAGGEKIEDSRFVFHTPEITQPHNLINGKLVDFQGAKFADFGAFRSDLIRRATGKIISRGASGGAYQSTDYFPGFRDTKERLSRYNITGLEGKTVFDIGCNYGMFSRAAIEAGAKRVVAADTPEVVAIARELAAIDGYFNIDFFGLYLDRVTPAELVKLTGISRFDVHFFLSMENWIGRPSWVNNCDLLYYEGHGENRNFHVENYRKKGGKK